MLFIKNTPLFLFLLLLFVLVISVLFANSREGFVSFQESKNPLDLVYIPTYSTSTSVTPVKLYDSIFFDNQNGNIIEVDSTRSGNVDTTGATIGTTYVCARNKSSTPVSYQNILSGNAVVPRNTPESQISGVSSSYRSYIYYSRSVNTNFYSVFCFPWNTDTYLHIINNDTKQNVVSNYFNKDTDVKTFEHTNSSVRITSFVPFVKPASTSTTETFYDGKKSLYKIGPYVKYDITNGNLIIQTVKDGASKSVTVFDRNGSSQVSSAAGTIGTTGSSVSNATFSPYVVLDTLGQNMVLYLPYKTNTVIALIGYQDATLNTMILNNVVRFTSTTVDKGTEEGDYSNFNRLTGGSSGDWPDAPPTSDSATSEYFKWYWYWKSTGGSTSGNDQTNDYLLKTQIVPPVCPSCPQCSGNGACTNCGGNGGSGTLSQNGSSTVGGSSPNTNYSNIGSGTFSSNANPDTIGGSLTLATYDTVAGVEDVAKTGAGVINNTVDTAGGIAAGGLLGAGFLGAATIGGAGYLADRTIDTVAGAGTGVKDIVTGAGSGVKDIVTGAGSGVKDILMQQGQGTNRGIQDQSQLNSQLYGQDNTSSVGPDGKPITINRTEGAFRSPYGTSSTDQYSYYGALPSKGNSNYMPVTADFSAFGK